MANNVPLSLSLGDSSQTYGYLAGQLYSILQKSWNATDTALYPTVYEQETVAAILTAAAQIMSNLARRETYAKRQRYILRPATAITLTTDVFGVFQSGTTITGGITGTSVTFTADQSDGTLTYLMSAIGKWRPGDVVTIPAPSVNAGMWQIQSVSSTTIVFRGYTGADVTVATADARTFTQIIPYWMRGCLVRDLTETILDEDNRMSRNLDRLTLDEDSHFPLSAQSVTVYHDTIALPPSCTGFLLSPSKRLLNGEPGCRVVQDKDGEASDARLVLRFDPLEPGATPQRLDVWLIFSPPFVTASQVIGVTGGGFTKSAEWDQPFPFAPPAGFWQTIFMPFAQRQLTRSIKFTGDEVGSAKFIIAEFFREYEDATAQLRDWIPYEDPDENPTTYTG